MSLSQITACSNLNQRSSGNSPLLLLLFLNLLGNIRTMMTPEKEFWHWKHAVAAEEASSSASRRHVSTSWLMLVRSLVSFQNKTKLSLCPLDLYCSLEVDSFGYFVNKAKTRVYRDSTEPNWNEVRVHIRMETVNEWDPLWYLVVY